MAIRRLLLHPHIPVYCTCSIRDFKYRHTLNLETSSVKQNYFYTVLTYCYIIVLIKYFIVMYQPSKVNLHSLRNEKLTFKRKKSFLSESLVNVLYITDILHLYSILQIRIDYDSCSTTSLL